MTQQAPSTDEVRAALDEVLGWQGISRSPQLSELLRYVVKKKLAGDENSIKAYAIAVDVFGRPHSFDPQSDPIVRVQARRLRTLLEQFYSTGQNRSAVQIHLPLGRYVPEFAMSETATVLGVLPSAASETDEEPAVVVAAGHAAVGRLPGNFLLNALLGLCFTLLGVAMAVAIVHFLAPNAFGPPPPAIPAEPRVTVGSFDNLTGDGSLDGAVGQLAPSLTSLLGRFAAIRVSDGGLTLSGAVQENAGAFSVKAQLGGGPADGIAWSTVVTPVAGGSAAEALDAAAVVIAAQLGTASGPLHAPGREWLKAQTSLPDTPTPYLCALEYMAWRDARKLSNADAAAQCFDKLLAAAPSDPNALAASSGLKAWRAMYQAKPTDDLVAAMAGETTAVAHAVALAPDNSFVYENQGLVLARQGLLDAAIGALSKAVELNPANMDARGVEGLIIWLTGDFAKGNGLSEEALAAIPAPAPYFYMTRALNALRERRFFDALDAGQSLAAGDDELGSAIVLAAAPQAARGDLIDRYRPLVIGNAMFQAVGILPRLGMTVKPQVELDALRDGMTLAGVPTNALTAPFNPDGTPKN